MIDPTIDIEEVVGLICSALKKEGAIVSRQDSITSDSVYLKIDYGAAHSLRVGGHPGIPKYQYKFNLRLDKTGMWEEKNRMFFGRDKVQQLVWAMITNRRRMMADGQYQKRMEEGKKTMEDRYE